MVEKSNDCCLIMYFLGVSNGTNWAYKLYFGVTSLRVTLWFCAVQISDNYQFSGSMCYPSTETWVMVSNDFEPSPLIKVLLDLSVSTSVSA